MIQEERMADAKSADGMVLPIKIKEDKITGKYASAEDLKAVTEFSLQKMEETTAKVLTGNIDKSPLCDSKTGSGWACEWCKAREVCRFMEGSGNPRVRAKEDDSLKKIIEKGREINSSLSNPIFLSKEEEAKFIDNIESDLDIEDEE
jgi:ATP-dependent helicase/DNAse subunit B